MFQKLRQQAGEVMFTEDKEVVQALLLHRLDGPLAESVLIRRSNGCS